MQNNDVPTPEYPVPEGSPASVWEPPEYHQHSQPHSDHSPLASPKDILKPIPKLNPATTSIPNSVPASIPKSVPEKPGPKPSAPQSGIKPSAPQSGAKPSASKSVPKPAGRRRSKASEQSTKPPPSPYPEPDWSQFPELKKWAERISKDDNRVKHHALADDAHPSTYFLGPDKHPTDLQFTPIPPPPQDGDIVFTEVPVHKKTYKYILDQMVCFFYFIF